MQAAAATSTRQQAEAASLSAQLAAANKELDLTLVAATRTEQEKGVLKEQVGALRRHELCTAVVKHLLALWPCGAVR
jgi:hypothetical protein